jgi:hypothetical protein
LAGLEQGIEDLKGGAKVREGVLARLLRFEETYQDPLLEERASLSLNCTSPSMVIEGYLLLLSFSFFPLS